jgi:DMSO/TMAO reductase YedYZ molybdopterin-dependent catalytic subunit
MAIKTPPANAEQELARRSRRSFLTLGAGAAVAAGGWLAVRQDPNSDDIPSPLRKVLNFNEKVVSSTVFNNGHLAKAYPASAIGKLKVNGDIGIDTAIDPAAWALEIPGGPRLTMADLQTLPRAEQTIDFKCIEGWSTVTQFAGARLSDFTAKFAPRGADSAYVSMQTPDKMYYVGVDMPGAMHPQTLLAWEMNGQPLTSGHGAPLRLVIPVKYGVKNIKRIATIEYTNKRPPDYWAEQGYDWYAGL